MTPTPTDDLNEQTSASTDPSTAEQIEQLQEQINRAQQTLRQIQNATGTGIGSTTPAKTKGGITIPAISGLSAVIDGAAAGETILQAMWVDAPAPVGATIDHYNVYVIQAFAGQSQPTLIGGSKQSPFVGAFQPANGQQKVTVAVQTVLSNGQALPLAQCPTTGVTGESPAKSVLSYLQGFVYQVPVTVAINTVGVTNALTASNANGGALISVTALQAGNGLVTFSSAVGLRITIDGSAATIPLNAPAQGFGWSAAFSDPAMRHDLSGTTLVTVATPYNVGFATSLKVDLVMSSGITLSGSITLTIAYALHT